MPKKPAFFLHGLDPAPSPFDIVKKMQDWYGGTSPTNDNATKVRSVEDLCPVKNLFDNMDVLISFTNNRAR